MSVVVVACHDVHAFYDGASVQDLGPVMELRSNVVDTPVQVGHDP